MQLKNNYHLIIPASGIGSRFGGDIPKQYTIMVNGLTILDNTIQVFLENGNFKNIIIALHKNDNFFQNSKFYNHPQITTVFGGKERFHSVKNGVDFLMQTQNYNDFVAVHDSVRPCVKQSDINNLLNKIDNHPVGGLLGVKAFDTLKSYKNNNLKTIDRSVIYHAFTPQIYRLGLLQQALNYTIDNAIDITDDASSIEEFGKSGILIQGSRDNIKITTQDDLKLANLILFGKHNNNE